SFSEDKSAMVVPMASNEGITALLSLKRPGRAFSNQDLFAVNALSGSSAVAMANALRYHRSTQEATTDVLTGLYNVRELRRRLDAVFARQDKATMSVSLLLIDFDHFKSVNDELGHQHGDLVLQMGARIARNAARAQVVVAAAHAVDHRAAAAQGHSSRVAAIAEAIARAAGLPGSDLEDLRTAAYLHDVGHMVMSDAQDLEVPGHAEEGEKIVAGSHF